jgi:DNA repair exonuclease SbcCD ATPase subunit
LTFDLKGATYTVSRGKGKDCLLDGEGEKIATGTKPVNEKIIDLFGYDLTVFDVSNNCGQGQVEALGDMKPTERKKMVDQTIGLNTLDDLSKWAGDQASTEDKLADALASARTEPVPPVEPEGYQPSTALQPDVDRLANLASEVNQLLGWLSSPAPTKPVRPSKPVDDSVELLQKHQADRVTKVQEINRLESDFRALGPGNRFAPDDLNAWAAQWDAYDRYQQKLSHERLYPKSEWPNLMGLKVFQDDWDVVEKKASLPALRNRLAALKAGDTHVCPNCSHEWPHEAEEIARVDATIEELEALPDVPLPPLTRAQIDVEIRKHESYKPNPHADAVEVAKPPLARAEIEADLRAYANAVKKDELFQRIQKLKAELPVDRAHDLAARQKYEWEVSQYDKLLAAYDAHQLERRAKEERFQEIKDAPQQYKALFTRLMNAKSYEHALSVYQQHKEDYERVMQAVAEKRHRAEQYRAVRGALKTLRSRVKAYLVPSLNKVASSLLQQMTGGARQQIVVDEEFNITVDGQKLETLSGSGKAVANIALRIGLGQVLTNRVFSVFMADEIDASMDQTRAEYTAACLAKLTESISQILLVSHKKPEADHYIEL